MKTEEIYFLFHFNIVLVKIPRISRDVQFRHTSLIPHIIQYAHTYTYTCIHIRDLSLIPIHIYRTGKTTPHKCMFLHTQPRILCMFAVCMCMRIQAEKEENMAHQYAYKYTRSSIALSSANKEKEHAAPLHAQISYHTSVFCKVMYNEIEHPEISEE